MGSLTTPPRFRMELLTTPPTSNLVAWYDASDISSITHASGDVSQFNDKSGNSYHLTPSVSGVDPVRTGDSTVNGLNVITFSSTSKWLLRSVFLTATPFTIYYVVRYTAAPAALSAPLSLGRHNAGFDAFGPLVRNADTTHAIVYNGTSNPGLNVPAPATGRTLIYVFGIGSTTTYSLDGQDLLGNFAALSGPLSGSFALGRQLDMAGGNMVGHFCEALIYSESQDPASIRYYLRSRWGA